jgi:ADP-heptose:LPS heptosyltransferase
MKILVIAMAGVGDTILATPLIRELRANFPDALIDALVLWAASKDVLEGNPALNTVFQKNLIKEKGLEALRFLLPLRKVDYDISINAHPQSRIHYRVISRVIGARVRISHLYECSGLLDRFLVNRTMPQDYEKHSVDQNLDLLSLLEKRPLEAKHELQIHLTGADHAWANEFLARQESPGRKRLGIHMGSGGTKNLALKRWPLGRYIQLLQKLTKECPEIDVLLFGGPEEGNEIEQVLRGVSSKRLVHVQSKTLKQAAALMQRCDAFLSADTALMHVAAAVKTPGQIVIEAFTLNKTNEPYSNPFVLVLNPAIAGRNLQFYRYDGKGIKGTREELIRVMESVSVEAVYAPVCQALKAGKELGKIRNGNSKS